MNDLSPVAIATRQQVRAADPNASVWVSASAGTGKTKVLTDRVLALMLGGTAPQRILCLTFTKAAAAEMANRIAETLSEWVIETDETLTLEVQRLLGRTPEAADLVGARQLFARVLETPGGMKIETIHAFCQSVLRRFPLEAGLPPHFDLLTDQDAADLLETARESVMARAHHDDADTLSSALSLLVNRVHETRFTDLMTSITFARDKIAEVLRRQGGVTQAAKSLRLHLGIKETDDPDSLCLNASQDAALDLAGLRNAAAALLEGSKTDQERGATIATWLEGDTATRANTFATYARAYLTTTGTIRKTLATKAVASANPTAVDVLFEEADRLVTVLDKIRAAEVAISTEALLTLGEAFLDDYQRRKASLARLDYDDLIYSTRQLLESPGVAAWVLFKLDGGLDHLLIDEAQDTSPDQWAVVKALSEEFFVGEGRHEAYADRPRTVFAVGDRKQSIYSFQGADPDGFDRMRAFFAERVTEAEKSWANVDLGVSFRSTSAILRAVDEVFKGEMARDGVVTDDDTLTHLAARTGQAGLVELWPPIDPDTADQPTPWKPPIERLSAESAPTRLARLIAKRVAVMCESGERLESKERAIQPGDILVLVRRRTGFVDDLVRALKDLSIGVAGVDRMVLIEQIAVMDLVALGRFLLLPQDDLTLATVLKSPLIGITEDRLFDLAHGRGEQNLWAALSDHAGADSDFGAAHKALAELLAQTDFLGPFALYAHVLTAQEGRRKLLSRLGMDADDPIDEFLAQALEYERRHTPSLEGFLHWLELGRLEVKRDLEQATKDAVRIMTVHGAKGLQAPIVFLPDTLQVPTQGDPLLWTADKTGKPLMLWPPSAPERDTVTMKLKDQADQLRDQEYRRLLYVAMTRAEDRLYICGWNTSRRAPDTCWYTLVKSALTPLADSVIDPFFVESGLHDGTVLRLSESQTAPTEYKDTPEDTIADVPEVPAFAHTDAGIEPAPPKPLAPSRPIIADPPVAAPLSSGGPDRFQRGLLIHRLLQNLPDLPQDSQRAAANAFLARPVWALDSGQRQAIAEETLSVLNHADFASVFGPGSKAEVPITGLIDGQVLSGQVDRLVVREDDVMIIDYKTNRPPPRATESVSEAYLFQMAAYRAALKDIYADKQIRCVLLWTDGPFIMELPDALLDQAWQQAGLRDV